MVLSLSLSLYIEWKHLGSGRGGCTLHSSSNYCFADGRGGVDPPGSYPRISWKPQARCPSKEGLTDWSSKQIITPISKWKYGFLTKLVHANSESLCTNVEQAPMNYETQPNCNVQRNKTRFRQKQTPTRTSQNHAQSTRAGTYNPKIIKQQYLEQHQTQCN